MYRHGDVLVAAVERLPEKVEKLNHRTLAEGEATGHSHRVAEAEAAELYRAADGLYLRVVGDRATLVHQEHGPIDLPRGDYRVWKQREYTPTEIRTVRD